MPEFLVDARVRKGRIQPDAPSNRGQKEAAHDSRHLRQARQGSRCQPF
jgi:hypothetical protein